MIDLFNIYKKLPYFLQYIIFNFKAFLIHNRRYKKYFFKNIYKKVLVENKYNKKSSQVSIEKKLNFFFLEANNTKYWKEKFFKYKINLNSNNFLNEIKKLPILTKEEVKKNIDNIINNKYLDKSIKQNTSGSTGSGLFFPITNFSESYTWAYWWFYRKKHGIKFNEICAVFAGINIFDINKKKPPFWIYNIFSKQLRVSSQHLNIDNVQLIINKIKQKKIRWIHGYPNAITHLSHLVIEKNIDTSFIKIISTGAESLLEHQIKIINKAFKCNLIQHYGLTEGVANIHQNTNKKLIVDENYSFVELINFDDDTYKIIGTNFHNMAFPLFRYQTDDIVKSSCYLKSNFPRVIDEIDGRLETYVNLKNGSKLGRLDYIFKSSTNVVEAQILQKKNYSLEIKIVKSIKFNLKDENIIKSEILKVVGKDIETLIKYVKFIKKTKTGKLRFVISELNNDY